MITAVVMVEAHQDEGIAGWMQQARRAAATDLLIQLAQQSGLAHIILVSPDSLPISLPKLHYLPSASGPIHVGECLVQIAHRWQTERILYFGGGSAPLLPDDTIQQVITHLASAEHLVFTNNQFASDWAGITPVSALEPWLPRLVRDNGLGWVLGYEAGLPVEALSPAAATRLDIDTPTDLLTLCLHPETRPHLRSCLQQLPLDTRHLVKGLQILATSDSRVFISGRIAPDVWQRLNQTTRVWLRVLSEERGMVSSGRQSAGQVRSLLGEHIQAVGLPHFFSWLAQTSDAAFLDTRVLLAHFGLEPSAEDRFASDLSQPDVIQNPWLRQLTELAAQSPVPIILGGHSLLAGNMLAFCEMFETGMINPGA